MTPHSPLRFPRCGKMFSMAWKTFAIFFHGVEKPLLAAALCCTASAAAQPIRVVYPRQLETDNRDAYKIQLLELALETTVDEFGPYECLPSSSVMTESRMDALMARGDGSTLNVIFKPTTIDREQSMLPVRIPIMKGLLGYRVFLIHEDSQPAFRNVKSIEDLHGFKVGQGQGWRDVEVFRHNGIPVVAVPDYETLFAMLAGKRFDGFSRGITEAPHEFDERKNLYPAMRIETDLLLHYPWPVYFFAMRNDEGRRLAQRIERGLQILIANGQFNALFDQYHKGSLANLRLGDRRLIALENPLLPPETPLDQPQFWLRHDELD